MTETFNTINSNWSDAVGTKFILLKAIVTCLLCTSDCSGEVALFEEDFNEGLSDKWQVVGLQKED